MLDQSSLDHIEFIVWLIWGTLEWDLQGHSHRYLIQFIVAIWEHWNGTCIQGHSHTYLIQFIVAYMGNTGMGPAYRGTHIPHTVDRLLMI